MRKITSRNHAPNSPISTTFFADIIIIMFYFPTFYFIRLHKRDNSLFCPFLLKEDEFIQERSSRTFIPRLQCDILMLDYLAHPVFALVSRYTVCERGGNRKRVDSFVTCESCRVWWCERPPLFIVVKRKNEVDLRLDSRRFIFPKHGIKRH